MSKAIGIVAEYNPFHNGHAHHLREAKRIAGNRPVIGRYERQPCTARLACPD